MSLTKDPQIFQILIPPNANNNWRHSVDLLLKGDITLKRGSTGENAIRAFQRLLIFLGYSTSTDGSFKIDGDFGRGTNRGLAQFLYEQGLEKRKLTKKVMAYECRSDTASKLITKIPDVTLTPRVFSKMLKAAKEAIDNGQLSNGNFEEAIEQLNSLGGKVGMSSRSINESFVEMAKRALEQLKEEKGISILPEWILTIIMLETAGVVRPRFEQHIYSRTAKNAPNKKKKELRFWAMSFGLGQIMGFNHNVVGAKSAFELFPKSIEAQIKFIAYFLASKKSLHSILNKKRLTKKDYEEVAKKYNGGQFKRNQYDEKLERWLKEFRMLNDPKNSSMNPTDEVRDFSKFISKYQEFLGSYNLDPGFKYQWYLSEANILKAWQEYGFGSKDITIAIIEQNFDIDHPDFRGKIVKGKDFDFGKEYEIQYHSDGSKEKFTIDKEFKLTKESSHGTSVASLAIGKINNKGIVGVAPNVKFMPIRIGGSYDEIWIEAFEYAVKNGAQIISCSLGYSPYQEDSKPLSKTIIKKLKELSKKAIFCFATGNAGKKNKGFSTHSDVIGVGACTVKNTLAEYSNTNKNTILTAPSDGEGLRVIASGLRGYRGQNFGDLNYNFGGTSAACPILAGVVALMLSQDPSLKVHKVKEILHNTGKRLVGNSKHKKIDAFKAVEEVLRRKGGQA